MVAVCDRSSSAFPFAHTHCGRRRRREAGEKTHHLGLSRSSVQRSVVVTCVFLLLYKTGTVAYSFEADMFGATSVASPNFSCCLCMPLSHRPWSAALRCT